MEVKTLVPSPDSKIMLVGDCPRREDITTGKPFSGPMGNTLRTILTRSDIYIGDCILANTSNVEMTKFFVDKRMSEPTPEYYEQLQRLKREIELYNPNIIVAMGAIPMIALTGEKGIKAFRGSLAECTLVPGKKVLITYHPQSVFFEYSLLYQAVMDMRKVLHESKSSTLPVDTRKLMVAPTKTDAVQYLKQIYNNRDTYKVAIDLEHITPGAHISWFGISHSKDFGMSIQFINNRQHCFPENDEIELWSWIAKICGSGIPLIFHNASYDVMNLWHNQGVWCENVHFDTLLAAHVVWPEFPRDLGFLASILLSVPAWKHTGGKQYEHGAYNAADACNTRALYEPLEAKVLEDPYYSKTFAIEMAQIEHTGFMQLQGMSIDTQERDRLREIQTEKMKKLEVGLSKILEKPINLSSPKQLANLLYVDIGLPTQYKRRKSVKDKRTVTTDKEALEKLYIKTEHPILKLILEHRRIEKTLQFINVDLSPEDKVHTSYNIAGTKFGRWSSSKSIILDYGSGNLQNIDRDVRSMYKAPSYPYLDMDKIVLLQADYKGAEAHVVAHLIQDFAIMKAFDEGLDVHKITASNMFKVNYNDVTDKQRKVGKTLRHGVNYSAGPMVLANWLKVTKKVAEGYLKDFHNGTPQLKIWHESLKADLNKTRTLITPLGRKHVFMERWGDQLFRSAYSFIPQSTIGDLLNLAMTTFYNTHDVPNMGLALQLHDAIYIWCYEDEAVDWGKELHRAMHIPIPMPYTELYIGVDFKVGKDWKNMEKLEVPIDV